MSCYLACLLNMVLYICTMSALFTTLSKENRECHTTSEMNTHIEDLFTECFY